MSKEKLVTKSIRLDDKEYKKLSAIAANHGATAAGIIRVMIAQYIKSDGVLL